MARADVALPKGRLRKRINLVWRSCRSNTAIQAHLLRSADAAARNTWRGGAAATRSSMCQRCRQYCSVGPSRDRPHVTSSKLSLNLFQRSELRSKRSPGETTIDTKNTAKPARNNSKDHRKAPIGAQKHTVKLGRWAGFFKASFLQTRKSIYLPQEPPPPPTPPRVSKKQMR